MTRSPSLRRLLQTLALSAGLLGAGASQASPLLSDAVEPNSGWVITGNALHFLSACCGIAPTAGSQFMHLQNIGGRLATQSFVGFTLQAGHYDVTFDIGNFSNAPFVAFDAIGMTAGGTLLSAAASSTATPADSTVGTWTLSYDIAAGHAAIGQVLGFRLSTPNSGVDANGSFDNLKIDFVAAAGVPEPATLMLVAVAALAGGASRRRTPAAG
jgi:PEP-CTERM motif